MKNYSKYLLSALCIIAVVFSAGAYMKVNAASEKAPAVGQPVDLTYASEKALPAVVYIKYVQNSKTQVIDVPNDPFSDIFGPFGFFGKLKKQKQKTLN